MPRVRITILFDRHSELAPQLGRHIFETFNCDGRREGPRIPVAYVRDPTPLQQVGQRYEHELIVVLLDKAMTSGVFDHARSTEWANLIADLHHRYPIIGRSPHSILPVALDEGGLGFPNTLATTSLIRADVGDRDAAQRLVVLHTTVRLLQMLEGTDRKEAKDGRTISGVPLAPISFFISHARADFAAGGPVESLTSLAGKGPIEHWYDSQNILPGADFAKTIETAVEEQSVFIAIVGDAWSSREWCRRELLIAKAAPIPVLIVDALDDRTKRLFPYVGNAPLIRWGEGGEKSAHHVVEAALIEALRYRTSDVMPSVGIAAGSATSAVARPTAPEALTLGAIPAGTQTVWYPDPPLGQEEVDALRRVRPGLDFSTRLTQLAAASGPPRAIAISLSEASDTEEYGGSTEHLALLADDLVLYLLLAGATVHYGGDLGHGALDNGVVRGDPINYVDRLAGLVRSYADLVQLTAANVAPVRNWVAWPIHLGPNYQRENLSHYDNRALQLERLERPPDPTLDQLTIEAEPGGFFAPASPDHRYAWAISLTVMRRNMLAATQCRIVLGGRLAGYSGLMPGVVEEALLSIETDDGQAKAGGSGSHPLFVLGAFGGAARLLGDLLQGRERSFTSGWDEEAFRRWNELASIYADLGRPHRDLEQLAADIADLGTGGLAAALNNGLSDEDNEELFECADSLRAVELILQGMSNLD